MASFQGYRLEREFTLWIPPHTVAGRLTPDLSLECLGPADEVGVPWLEAGCRGAGLLPPPLPLQGLTAGPVRQAQVLEQLLGQSLHIPVT